MDPHERAALERREQEIREAIIANAATRDLEEERRLYRLLVEVQTQLYPPPPNDTGVAIVRK